MERTREAFAAAERASRTYLARRGVLDQEQVAEITSLLLDRLTRRLRARRIEVEFTADAVELLAREGFDPEFGARPLRRTIQRMVENALSRMVLSGTVQPGHHVRIDALENELHFDIDTKEVRASEDERQAAQTT